MKHKALILAVLMGLAACKHTVHDSGCISLYTGLAQYQPNDLDAGKLDTIHHLFTANGISMDHLNFIAYFSDTVKDSSGTPIFSQWVNASLVFNGLPVFSSYLSWNFHNGVLFSPNNLNPHYADPEPDSTGHQTLSALRSLFFKGYEAALYTGHSPYRSKTLGRPGIYYHDSCLQATLGYIDASWPPNSSTTFGNKLLKAWLVRPVNAIPGPMFRGPAPAVFVIDGTGQAWCSYPLIPGAPILFDDGVPVPVD